MASDLGTFKYNSTLLHLTNMSLSDCLCSARALTIALVKSLLVTIFSIGDTLPSTCSLKTALYEIFTLMVTSDVIITLILTIIHLSWVRKSIIDIANETLLTPWIPWKVWQVL